MEKQNRREYLIRRDGHPYKFIEVDVSKIVEFTRRLSRRFPQDSWSVAERSILTTGD
jgi:hypothetical protein|tara:strand:- start:2976 stop:3146 length:171 start_codon:yes stop_codon:yes gene_type:complete